MSSSEMRMVYYVLRIGVDVQNKASGRLGLSQEATVEELRSIVFDESKDVLSLRNASPLNVYGPFSEEDMETTNLELGHSLLPGKRVSGLLEGVATPYFVIVAPEPPPQAPAAERFQPPWQQHRNVEKGVFVLYRGDDGNAEPIGTAFAISTNLLLTACHNVVVKSEDGNADMEVTKLKIAPAIKKTDEGKFAAVTSREVSVYRYCIPVDWAALKLHDGALALRFVIPMATADSDMPPRATLEKLYIYHCPVGLFLEDDDTDQLHVTLKEASVGVINTKTLTYQNGAFPGSSGGPYIFRNKAVALHTESVSTSKTAEDIRAEASAAGRKRRMTTSEVALMVADSCVSSHTSHGSGIMLHVRSGIMRLLNEANQQPDGSSRNTLEHIDRTSN